MSQTPSIMCSAAVRRAVAALSSLLGAMALAPSTTQASVGAGAAMNLPSTVSVGQTQVTAALLLHNTNTPPDNAAANTVCNAGDQAPACASNARGIVLIPGCGRVNFTECVAPDRGVLRSSATGSGRAGTACAATAFSIDVVDGGTVRFTPQPAGSRVTLAGEGSRCVVDFTFDVLRSPTVDVDPAMPGVQTAVLTRHAQAANVFDPASPSGTAAAVSIVTVLPAPVRCRGRSATIVAAAGQTVVRGTAGPDVIVGTAAADTIDGLGGDDTICAGSGSDTVHGGSGDDMLAGDTGNDRLRGDGGDDLLLGGSGGDDLRGATGNDRMGGGAGADRIDGGSGDDLLDDEQLGGSGRDRLFGGTGDDRVHTAGGNADTVDCGPGGDRVRINGRDRQQRCEVVRRI